MTTSAYQPPYTITSEILNLIAAISEGVGRLTVLSDQTKALRLRRIIRIRTIHGSLAIEGNTLNEAQITAILEGKRVIAPPREIPIAVTPPQVTPPSRRAAGGTPRRNGARGTAIRIGAFRPQIFP